MHGAPYVKCYSANLHLLDNEYPETQEIVPSAEFRKDEEVIFRCDLNVREDDMFYPWAENYVSFSIHSPFVPPNPFYEGNSLQEGYAYIVSVSLEEEHLQPAPYPTDCTDYEALWEKNNKTGPRSQEMCRAYCQLIYLRKCQDCDLYQRVYIDSMKLCPKSVKYPDSCDELRNDIDECKLNCKPECVKLKYKYTTVKIKPEPFPPEAYDGVLRFNVRVRGTEVSILSHNPVYGLWEIFSHIGGLVGCWLGISVWTAINVFEDLYKRIVKLAFMVRNRSKRLASTFISPMLRQV
ncbi:hypothetical protein CDAR_235441 [Caerostris darwini]|nr:hypothetical protein CDAR_235441 [Caerostris darwini]